MLRTYREQLIERENRTPCRWCGQPRSVDHPLPDGRILWFCACGSRVYTPVRW